MRTPKNQIKRIILKKIKLSTIEPMFHQELLKRAYKTFLFDLNQLKRHLIKGDYELWFDRIYFTGFDNLPYYYEIQRNGSLEDISEEVQKQIIDNQKTIDDVLRS